MTYIFVVKGNYFGKENIYKIMLDFIEFFFDRKYVIRHNMKVSHPTVSKCCF